MPYAVIQSACFCEWCHVAIVIELTDGQVEEIRNRYYAIHPSEKPKPASKATSSSTTTPVVVTTVVVKKDRERKYVLEATTDNLRCAVTGKLSDGVKLTPLEKNIKRCDPTIGNYYGIKKALPRDDRIRLEYKKQLVERILPELLNRPYERDYSKLVKTWVRWAGGKQCCDVRETDESTIFCTELLVHILTDFGLLNAYHDSGRLSSATENNNYGDTAYDGGEGGGERQKKQRWNGGLGFCYGIYWHCQCSAVSPPWCCSSSSYGQDIDEYGELRDTYYTDEDITVREFMYIEKRFSKRARMTYESAVTVYR